LSVTLKARSPNKELARDIATAIPKALVRTEQLIVMAATNEKAEKLRVMIRDASDFAAQRADTLEKFGNLHGQSHGPVTNHELERARWATLLADAEVERLNSLLTKTNASSAGDQPRLIFHSTPRISDSPSHPKIESELNSLVLHSLISGFILALLLPYLCELAFPPQNILKTESQPTDFSEFKTNKENQVGRMPWPVA
jgi:hypothetical protein